MNSISKYLNNRQRERQRLSRTCLRHADAVCPAEDLGHAVGLQFSHNLSSIITYFDYSIETSLKFSNAATAMQT